MTQSLARPRNTAPLTVEQALVLGDLSGLDPEQRVKSRIVRRLVVSPNGCWEWQGAKTSAGYGQIRVPGSHVPAYVHRVMYGPIEDGLTIDHLCRNRSCCNPAHLEAVSLQVNLQRGNGMSARHARAESCSRGHEKTADNTYVRPNGERACRACRRLRDLEFKRRRRCA